MTTPIKKGKNMEDVLNKIFSEHLIEMLAIYNKTGEKLAELELKSYERAIGNQKTARESD